MQPRLIDSHTHVQFPIYKDDREDVINRAFEKGIWMVNIGTHLASSQSAIELADKYDEGMYASVGFHPGHIGSDFHDTNEEEVKNSESFDFQTFLEIAKNAKVVGIGECGLDFYRTEGLTDEIKEKQKEVFIHQVKLAHEVKKPLIIHCRDAFDDAIEILTAHKELLLPRAGVIHFFSGTIENMQNLLNLGFYFGFGGVVTFAKAYEKIVEATPLEKILLETDAPYVAPVPFRGKRNEPLYMESTAAKIASWKGVSVDEVAQKTTQNARELFNI
jgi:TatD DNase family protein